MLVLRTHLNVCDIKMLLGAEMLEPMIQGFSHPTFYMLISKFFKIFASYMEKLQSHLILENN